MPVYDVWFDAKVTYYVQVEAESMKDAAKNYANPKYWIGDEADPVDEFILDDSTYIEEVAE